MVHSIRDKLDGIVSFWTFRHISNASMEGFNNKIRWLIKQVYGFRDREYFKLKIYQLPEISCKGAISYVKVRRRGKKTNLPFSCLFTVNRRPDRIEHKLGEFMERSADMRITTSGAGGTSPFHPH